MLKPEISIVIPCLDEVETIAICVRKALEACAALNLRGEVVVADNGSTDGSQDLARRQGARVVDIALKGYGEALMGGMAAAQGDWLLFADADDSYDFSEIAPFVEKLRAGFDFVIGCRFPSGGGTIKEGAMPWHHRYIGTPVISWLGRTFYKVPVTDFNCGMRALTRGALERMDLRTSGMEFASEMIVKAALNRLRIAQVPIVLHKAGRSRAPHLRSFRDGWLHLRFLLMYSPLWLFFIPGTFLFLLGFSVGARLVFGPIQVGAVGFDTNTLIVCGMLVILGLQLISLAVFSTVFATEYGLRPPVSLYSRFVNNRTLEGGVLLGLAITLFGVAVLFGGLSFWRQHDFGPLPAELVPRIVVPATVLIVAGVQCAFSSFMLGILRLRRR